MESDVPLYYRRDVEVPDVLKNFGPNAAPICRSAERILERECFP